MPCPDVAPVAVESEVVETYFFLGHWDREKMRFSSDMHERAILFDFRLRRIHRTDS